jgi:hypothetical protein
MWPSILQPERERIGFHLPTLIGAHPSDRGLIAERLVALVIVFVVAYQVMAWQLATEANVVPYHDGSHHVANVANLVAGIRTQGIDSFTRFAERSPSDALTYGVLAIAASVVGVGRHAFGVLWAACLATIWIALALHFRKQPLYGLAFGISLLLFLGLFQSHLGGAWDTRVDLFAVVLACVSLLLLVNGRLFEALLFGILASFAKGAAVSLLVPLLAVGALLGFARLGSLLTPTIWGTLKVGLVALLATAFAVVVGPQTVSYNLMATGGGTLDQRVQLFLSNTWLYLQRDPSFYPADLYSNYHGWIVLLIAGLLIVGVVSRAPFQLLRLGVFALVAVGYTILLLTVSPLHSNVLTIWCLPSLLLCVVFVVELLARSLPAPAIAALTGVLLVPTLPAMMATPTFPAGESSAPAESIFQQAAGMANFLDQQFAGRGGAVVILVNFLDADPPLSNNYDVYRVLIQERLRRANLIIDGWELGTYGVDWHRELLAQQQYSDIYFVIQQEPHGIAAGPAVRDFLRGFRSQHIECLTEVTDHINLPRAGLQEVLRLTPTAACREALFT